MKIQKAAVSISIDLRKHRIRLHKSTLHAIGDPPYIQLLVNPSRKIVAIKGTNQLLSGDAVHKISREVLESDNSVEIYSSFFIEQLIEVASTSSEDSLLRLTGEIISSEHAAIFPLSKIQYSL